MVTKEDLGLFHPDLVFCDIDAADTDELFELLGQRLSPKGYIKENWLSAIKERERDYATGLQTQTIGVAIPHADNCVNKAYIAIVKPVHPVVFQPMGGIGDPVSAELIINLGILREGGEVDLLQGLMRIFLDDDATNNVMQQETPEGIVNAITSRSM